MNDNFTKNSYAIRPHNIALNSINNTPQFTNLTVEHREKEELYWKESLQILNSIEQNTASIATLVDLISNSKENQDEIISCLTELNEIAKSKTSEEAKSKFAKVMQRITGIAGDVDAIVKLTTYGNLVYNFVIQNIDKLEVTMNNVNNLIK